MFRPVTNNRTGELIANVQEWLGHANVSDDAPLRPAQDAPGGQPDVPGEVLVYIYENPVDISQAQALVHLPAVVGTGRQLVADQLAAAAGESRRTVDKARPVLRVAAGGESSDAEALWEHAAQDRDGGVAGGIGAPRSADEDCSPWIALVRLRERCRGSGSR